MRYRPVNTMTDLRQDIGRVVEWIGHKDYFYYLESVGVKLRKKGYVTEADDILHSLELQLFNIEVNRRISGGKAFGSQERLHEAYDFLIGLGQTLPVLSPSASARLRSSFLGALKATNLRSLQHELRIAGRLCQSGCEVSFNDWENIGGFDVLAERDGFAYEVEAKSVSPYSGHPVPPVAADKLFAEARHGFRGLSRTDIPVIDIQLADKLPTKKDELQEIVELCSALLRSSKSELEKNGTKVRLVGEIADLPPEEAIVGIRSKFPDTPMQIYVRRANPKLILRVFSLKASNLFRNIAATVSEASSRQFTKLRPAVVWVNLDFVASETFDALSSSKHYMTPMDTLALMAFTSDKRRHLSQLVFTGAAELVGDGLFKRSGVKHNVYNSDRCSFDAPYVLPNGRSKRR